MLTKYAFYFAVFGTLLLTPSSYAQDFQWAKGMGGTSNDVGKSIVVDENGNIFTLGDFSQTADFDPGPGAVDLVSNGIIDLFVTKQDNNGNLIWAKSFGGTSFDEGKSIALDPNGNILFTGSFRETVDFDPSAGAFNMTSLGYADAFICKLDNDGNFVWAKQLGGTSGTENLTGYGISVDDDGNVYTTGNSEGTVDFDPGAGVYNLTSAGSRDAFVSKLDANGNFLWATLLGNSGYDTGRSLKTDSDGAVYLTGNFQDTVDFDPGSGVYNLTCSGTSATFIAKLDTDGNFVWTKKIDGTNTVWGYALALTNSNNVYVSGRFRDTVDLDPGANTQVAISNASSGDIFVSKLSTNGDFIWAKHMGGPDSDEVYGITVNDNENIYATGLFIDTVDFDPSSAVYELPSAGGYSCFVFMLSGNGDFLWARRIGGAEYDYGWAVALDPSQNILVTGEFDDVADFNPDFGNYTMTSLGGSDVFIAKFSNPTSTVLENGVEQRISVYPNPTNGNLTIDIGDSYEAVTVDIIDVNGRRVQTSQFNNTALLHIDFSAPAGVYFLSVTSPQYSTAVQLIKQ